MPVLEKVDVLSLEVFSIELPPAKGRAADGAPLEADCAAQLKIKSDDASLEAAAEHFLNKKPDEIKSVVRPVLEKHLRAALGSTNLAAVQQNPDALASQMESAAASGLAKMGLDIISFTVHDVRTA
jgi:flotillin